MQSDLYRVEAVEIAINQGANSQSSIDHIAAHGMASNKNPLGNAITHLEASISTLPNGHITYSGNAFYMAKLLLSGELERMHICDPKDSTDQAEYGLRFFIDKRCPCCKGTGVINIEQETCQMCAGSKTKPHSPVTYKVYKVIQGYQEWMEAQLCKKLKSNVYHALAKPHMYGQDIPESGSYRMKYKPAD